MSSPDNALQAGLYARLTGYAALTAALGGSKVYDFVPQSATPPYVVIGDDGGTEWDTKSRSGWEFVVNVHAWDFEKAGRKSVKTVLGHVFAALHRQEANVTVSGFTLVDLHREFQETFQETAVEGGNDRYWHGVIRFRATIHS